MSKKTNKGSPLGNLLKRHRKNQGMTMKNLAQAVGVSESYISLLESGQRTQPARELVLKIAKTLGADSFNNLADDFLVTAGFYPADKQSYRRHQDTLLSYKARLKSDPTDFETFSTLVFALIKTGQTQEAQDLIQQGLAGFDDTIQLQALLASLELAKKNYQKSLDFQNFALSQTGTDPKEAPKRLRLTINLGVIHFLKGVHHQAEHLDSGSSKSHKAALKHFEVAHGIFGEVLDVTPENIYVLDELARVSFNLATLNQGKKAQKYWQDTISSLKKVLQSEDKYTLGHSTLLESCVFLAHAYTKTLRFDEALTLLSYLEITMNPPHWLVPYAKACFYSLKFEEKSEPALLDLALKQLALAIQYAPQTTSQQAIQDPDLSVLREHKESEFKALIL